MYYIVYNSVTFATGIKNKFRYDKDNIRVMHTPAKISTAGCSYSIRVDNFQKATEIINASKEYGVKIKGFYKQNSDSEFEKMDY